MSNVDSAVPQGCQRYGQEWICEDRDDCRHLGTEGNQLVDRRWICAGGGCGFSNHRDDEGGYICHPIDGANVFCVVGPPGVLPFCVDQSYCVEGYRVGLGESYLCRDSLHQPVVSVPPDVPCPPGEREPRFELCDGTCPSCMDGHFCMARSGARSIGLCGSNTLRCGMDRFDSEGWCRGEMSFNPSFRCTCAVMPEAPLGFATEAATCLAYRSIYPDVECYDLLTSDSL